MFRVFLTDLNAYTFGTLEGYWLELPTNLDHVKRYVSEFITDYENDYGYKVGEYETVESLNELAEMFDSLDETEAEVLSAMLEYGLEVEEALEKISDGDYRIYYDCHTMADVAYEIVEECDYLHNVPEIVARYFDYNAFGLDLDISGTFIFYNNICVEIIY